MWYEKVILGLQGKSTYSRSELFSVLQKVNSKLSRNSFKWILADIVSKQMLTKVGYDSYIRSKDTRYLFYQYTYSEIANDLKEKINTRFPTTDYCIFETFMLNEFLDSPIPGNSYIFQVEKEFSVLVFEFLSEISEYRILYKPDKESLKYYWCEDCVIVMDKITEAPLNKQRPHDMVLEKLVVDVLVDGSIKRLLSEKERLSVAENIFKKYYIDEKRMMRYARRRNAEQRMKALL